MGKFNKLSIIIITLMVCIFGSLIVYFALFKNNDDVNVNIDNSHNSNLSNNISGNNTNTTPVVKDDIKYLETKIVEEDSTPVQDAFNNRSNTVQKMNALHQPLFRNNSEKYEYLIKNYPNNSWIEEFKKTKEYTLLYE